MPAHLGLRHNPHTVAVIVLSQGVSLLWLPGHSHLAALGAEPHPFHHVLSLPLSVPKAFSCFARTQGAISISVPRMLQDSPHVPPQCQGLPQLSILGDTFLLPQDSNFVLSFLTPNPPALCGHLPQSTHHPPNKKVTPVFVVFVCCLPGYHAEGRHACLWGLLLCRRVALCFVP